MTDTDSPKLFSRLSTPLVADACVRLGLPVRMAPAGVSAVPAGSRVAGRVLPVRHHGSVDVFLTAFETAQPGDVLVIDDGGRVDRACAGDLTALEARAAGLAGIVIWGCHRDTPELRAIGFPVFSYGAYARPPEPDSARPGAAVPDAGLSARFGDVEVCRDDLVFADEDGIIFVAASELQRVIATAEAIRETERRQADLVRAGRTLRDQFRFSEYLRRRETDPGYTFRDHLRAIGGAIEQ